MKVAIIYDAFLENGGAEKSILITAKKLNAPIFTSHIDRTKFYNVGVKITSSRLTFDNHKILTFTESAFRLRNWLKSNENFLRDNFDIFLISGIYGISASFLHPNNFLCFTPPRSLYSEHKIIKERLNFPKAQIFDLWIKFYKKYDLKWASEIDKFLSISDIVKLRIARYYNRHSEITYLPVETKKYKFNQSGDFWFCPNRLTTEKRIDLIIDAFKKLPNEKLIIAGDGPEKANILNMIENHKNIKYVGNLDYEQMIDYYSKCKGSICLAQHEDLGLVPIESMASGKPCIIPIDGSGLVESIIPCKTGWIISPDTQSLINLLKEISAPSFDYYLERMKKDCIERSKMFDVENYIKRIKTSLEWTASNVKS